MHYFLPSDQILCVVAGFANAVFIHVSELRLDPRVLNPAFS